MKRLVLAIHLATFLMVLTVGVASAQPQPSPTPCLYCILRKPMWTEESRCYEFYLADCNKTGLMLMCTAAEGGPCLVTEYAARQGWEVDSIAHPSDLPIPYLNREAADFAMTALSPYGGTSTAVSASPSCLSRCGYPSGPWGRCGARKRFPAFATSF